MDNPDLRSAVKEAFAILRKATRIAQIVPFVYLFFFAVYLLAGQFLEDGILCAADTLFSASPIATVGMLIASRLFKLCVWHKAACLFPTVSQVEGYIDSFVLTFTQEEIIVIHSILAFAVIFFLLSAYIHFFASDEK